MVRLHFKGFWYDLTPHVDLRSVSVKHTADKTFDTASFKIPQIENVFPVLDMTRPLPREARVEIFDDEFIIQTDNIMEIADGIFSHDVECVSLAKILADTTNAGLTVTQPSGDVGLYYRTYSRRINERLIYQNESGGGAVTSYVDTTFLLVEQSADLNEIDGRTVKKNKKYILNVSFELENKSAYDFWGYVKIQVGGADFEEKIFGIKKAASLVFAWTPARKEKRSLSFELDNVGVNEIKVLIRNATAFDLESPPVWKIRNIVFTISTSDEKTMERIKLDYVVEKLLSNDANLPKFALNENTKSYLNQFESYEWTLQPSYLWLHLTRIADYIKAFPTAEFVDNKIEISITPFDEMSVEYEPIGVAIEASQATIDDYASALEIAANNVYNDTNTIQELVTLRADGETTQIDTDSLIIPTKERIGSIVDFRIKVPKNITVNSITITKGTWISIDTDRILREEYYNTLGSKSEYNGAGRFSFSKNNCLYFKDGEKGIHGLSFFGQQLKTQFTPANHIRAIYELLIAQLVRDYASTSYNTTHCGDDDGYDDGTVTLDNEIMISLEYRPYTSSNAVIFKSDQSGFVFKTVKYSGEEMNINSPDVLGSYIQGVADRSGGTIHTFTGTCHKDELPPILSTWGDLTLFALAWQYLNSTTVSYSLQYIKDYVFISSYESYNPKERQVFLVPRTAVQDRVIKKNIHLVLDTQEQYGDETGIDNTKDFFSHLIAKTDKAPFLAKVRGEAENGTFTSAVPIITQSIGRTIEMRVEMKDNYSAGLTKYTQNGNTYQKDWNYTDIFGRVEFTTIELHTFFGGSDNNYKQLPNPLSLAFGSSSRIATMGFDERKDARERSVYSLQFTYMSGNDDIIIYDSIGRFSNFTPRGTRDIKCVSINRVPQKSQKIIDASYVVSEVSVSLVDLGEGHGYIDTDSSFYSIAFYDKNTGELLLVDTRFIANRKIYYRGQLV